MRWQEKFGWGLRVGFIVWSCEAAAERTLGRMNRPYLRAGLRIGGRLKPGLKTAIPKSEFGASPHLRSGL